MEIFKRVTEFDFMAKKTMAVTLSCAVILIGLISIVFHGGLRYGIDFAGGTLVQLKFKNPPIIEEVRDGLRSIDLGDSTIQEFGSKNHLLGWISISARTNPLLNFPPFSVIFMMRSTMSMGGRGSFPLSEPSRPPAKSINSVLL